MSARFASRKHKILAQLEAPDGEYHDLSPKGSVDEPIRPLIATINRLDGLATTSSCSGRVSVFLEGNRAPLQDTESQDAAPAGPGGKGGGGSWLFVSHDPVVVPHDAPSGHFTSMFGLRHAETGGSMQDSASRYIHFKFEPMILHILTASLQDSQRVLTAALCAGFRESGAVSLNPSKSGELNPIVAVRSTGYSLDAIVGYCNSLGENVALVDEKYLRTLVTIAAERFKINGERIARFQSALLEQYDPQPTSAADLTQPAWEDAQTRAQRKKAEGLARQRALKAQTVSESAGTPNEPIDGGSLAGVFG